MCIEVTMSAHLMSMQYKEIINLKKILYVPNNH